MDSKTEFRSTHIIDKEMYKEFSSAILATNTAKIILSFILLALFVFYLCMEMFEIVAAVGAFFGIVLLIILISGRYNLGYKRYRSLNGDKDVEITVKINDEKIVNTRQDGSISYFEFSQITRVVETKNLLILMLKYNSGIIITKNNIEGGTKEELIRHLLLKCPKVKPQKALKSEKWQILRKVIFILYIVIFLFSVAETAINLNQLERYKDYIENKGYVTENTADYFDEDRWLDGIVFYSENTRGWNYVYEFPTTTKARNNLNAWTESEMQNAYPDDCTEEKRIGYEKYTVNNGEEYFVFIRKRNVVFYTSGSLEDKEAVDSIADIIEEV